ncbi:hypothetical protein BC828DRAFT_375072 [Blastocladiella britannica]|nr:hypothetical protein BC828DRAFT_375072 [Blastocladiella britannica]
MGTGAPTAWQQPMAPPSSCDTYMGGNAGSQARGSEVLWSATGNSANKRRPIRRPVVSGGGGGRSTGSSSSMDEEEEEDGGATSRSNESRSSSSKHSTRTTAPRFAPPDPPPMSTTTGTAGPAGTATGLDRADLLVGLATRERSLTLALLDHITDLFLALAPNGTIMWASATSRQVVGFASSEIAGHHLGEFVHPEDVQPMTRALTQAVTSQSALDVKARIRRKNADYIVLHMTGRVLDLGGNNAAQQPPTVPDGHPLSLPYGLGNMMASAAAISDARGGSHAGNSNGGDGGGLHAHLLATHGHGTAQRSPLVVAVVCREHPATEHSAMLDGVLDLQVEHDRLRAKLAAAYARRKVAVPANSALHTARVPSTTAIAAAIPVDPAALRIPDQFAGSPAVADGGLAAAIVPSDLLRAAMAAAAAATAVPTPRPDHMRVSELTNAGDFAFGASEGSSSSSSGGDAPPRKRRRKTAGLGGPGTGPNGNGAPDERVCIDCGTTKSPEWRKGPGGSKTLCNACGLRFAKRNKQRQQRQSLEAALALPTTVTMEPVAVGSTVMESLLAVVPIAAASGSGQGQ